MQNPVKNGTEPAGVNPSKHDASQATDDKSDNLATQPYIRARSLTLSFHYAFQGVWYALRTQRNFRVHAIIMLVVVIAGLLLGISLDQWAVVAIVVGLVFQTELINTAVEAIVDRVSPEYHLLAKIAKDSSAAAVLVAAISAVVAGLLIFGPKILMLLKLR